MAEQDGRIEITRCEHIASGDWLLAFATSDTEAFAWLVSQIKSGVHSTQRQWASDQKCWRISNFGVTQLWRWLPRLRAPMERMARSGTTEAIFYQRVRQQSSQGSQGSQQRHQQSTRSNVAPVEVADAFTTLYLLPSAPLSVIKAVYRALANIHHPDHGGAHDTMLRLNNAYERASAWANKTASKAG